MAELNLKQITDKLNNEFSSDVRKLVFWYDANAEFVDDVDTIELVNAKVLHMEQDNQFYIKYFLECIDRTTNYLVYAPFAKPSVRDNHLADTIRYSKEFFADRASLLTLDLGIDERFKPVIQKYIKFFGEKKRTQAFYDLELEVYNPNTIEIGLMSVLCKCKTPSFEEVLRTILTDADFDNNPYLEEFEKYGLLDAFWKQAQNLFGYADENPTLEKFTMSMFITYASRAISADMPIAWIPFISFKYGSVVAFIDNLMNSYLYGQRFDEISELMYKSLNCESELPKLPIESLVNCGLFAGIDKIILNWMIERLELEDVSAKLGEFTIPQLLKKRRQGHFGKRYRSEYFVIENAWAIISGQKYEKANSLGTLIKGYTDKLYQMDRRYRYFYYYLDKLEDSSAFDNIKELVENIYSNEYLSKICVNWNEYNVSEIDTMQISKQSSFYSNYVNNSKEQLVVIISDALRYEVGVSLFEKLQADEKCNATIKPMLSVLPSITEYGMAALLPHRKMELGDDYSVTVDGMKTASCEQRQIVLQTHKPASRCVQYDDIKNMSVADLRNIFTRQDVVYIYHNQIDARGDKLNTENEVFNACEEAVEEISALIRRLTTSANKSNFIVTADHGFIYRRNKLTESDKIDSVKKVSDVVGRRYALSEEGFTLEGVSTMKLKVLMKTNDDRCVSYPIGENIFKAAGAGINYVHGGSSPQEMIVPLIEVKTERGYKETKTVQIELVSLVTKLTNLITSLDFVQTEAISDVVKETTYRLYFVDQNGNKISNEHLYIADKKDKETVKRVFKLRFSLKNKKYSKAEKYYLVAIDDNNSLEVLRHEVLIDIAFADDFGFDL